MAHQWLDASGHPMPEAVIRHARTQAMIGAYMAANGVAPEMKDWAPPTLSADAALEGERQDIADRAQDLDRSDALVAGATQSLKDSAFAFGLEYQSMPDYRTLGISRQAAADKARELEAIMREWGETPDYCDVTGEQTFGGMTRTGGGSMLIDGESLALALWLPERQRKRGSRFATVLQTVEGARLSNPYNRASSATMRDGVEIDDYGAPVAYHFRKAHPGDQWLTGDWRAEWERVPARGPNHRRVVLHCYDKKRPGQHRGVSWLAPVMPELKQRARYQRAELQAAVVNSVIAAVLESPADGQTLTELFGSGQNWMSQRNALAPVQLGIGPGGAIPRLFPGEKLTGYAGGRPSSTFDPFMTSVTRLIAAGLGMTYETFMRDFSKTNYSSARASLLEGWRFILFLRMLATLTWCRPVLDLVVEEAVWRGYIDLPGFSESRTARQAWLRGVWRGPARGWVDPVKEVQAAAMRVRLGISTLRDEALEQGRDLDDLLDQIALEQESLRERGLTLPEVDFTPRADQTAPEDQQKTEDA